jgi:16S rRNA (cytosine967-C5)-methyltransferase
LEEETVTKTINSNTREIALGILMEIVEKNNFSHQVLSRTLGQYQELEKQDRAFITRLCEGTTERLLTLDFIINCYSNVKVNKMKPVIRNLLRLSVYQLKYMNQVPDSAACNEAVKLAKKKGFGSLSGFVNGVLRNIIRFPEKVVYPEETKEPVKFLSITYSVPEWLIKHLLEQYEFQGVKAMLDASFEDKKTSIRCNLNQTNPTELKAALEQSGVTVSQGLYLPYAFKISDYNYLEQLEPFRSGQFLVQDESSMLVGAVSGVKQGDYVIDVCAAPGGKSLHVAEIMGNSGHVDSRDVSERKVALINDNIKRLKLKNIGTKVQDAVELEKESIGKADIVIADLPCSGLGIIGKKPDIKYNMTKEKMNDLVQVQREILDVVQKYVKPNGVLIYSTCTVNKEENIGNVLWFKEHYNYILEDMDAYLPRALRSETTKAGYMQLLPGVHALDGFFIARFRKSAK